MTAHQPVASGVSSEVRAAMRARAEAATPDTWEAKDVLGLTFPTQIDGWTRPDERRQAQERIDANKAHIAGMDPATTLTLLDALDEADDRTQYAERYASDLQNALATAMADVTHWRLKAAEAEGERDRKDGLGRAMTAGLGRAAQERDHAEGALADVRTHIDEQADVLYRLANDDRRSVTSLVLAMEMVADILRVLLDPEETP